MNNILTGRSFDAYKTLGCHLCGDGLSFTFYEPNAEKVSICFGGRSVPCTDMGDGSFRYITDENIGEYCEEVTLKTGETIRKADPYAFMSADIPKNGSKVCTEDFSWTDGEWLKNRTLCHDKPMNIYEVHAGSWRKNSGFSVLRDELVPYAREMGYTHIELMPVTCHPNLNSWGYQSSGYFCTCPAFGTPDELKGFVDACHANGIGVIFDLSLVHFAADEWALDHADNVVYGGEISPWGSPKFNVKSPYVRSFLQSAAAFAADRYHADGLRIDAVSEYMNDTDGEKFLRGLTEGLHKLFPPLMLIAEDSSISEKVTVPVKDGGFGFDYKQNLGWMNDTFAYMSAPVWYRPMYDNAFMDPAGYADNASYILPLSHDECVHEKGALPMKMYGSEEQKLASVRLLYLYMTFFRGKKLSFMGNELGIFSEWSEDGGLDLSILRKPENKAFHEYIRQLNVFYLNTPLLWKTDDENSFEWRDFSRIKSVFVGRRTGGGQSLKLLLNFSLSPQNVNFFPDDDISEILIATADGASVSRISDGYSAYLPPVSGIIAGNMKIR